EPGATMKSAVALLAEKRIGAVLVLGADNRIVGILSERDIVRAIAERSAAALDEPVSRSMTRKVSTCTESETIATLMERMTEGKFRHLPVVDQGRLVGIISIGDVVKHRLQEMERDSAAMRDYILTAEPAEPSERRWRIPAPSPGVMMPAERKCIMRRSAIARSVLAAGLALTLCHSAGQAAGKIRVAQSSIVTNCMMA